MKGAFTLLEVVLVIVITAILGSISFEVMVRIYQNYQRSDTINRLEFRSLVLLEQISSRLAARIKQRTFVDSHEINWSGYDEESLMLGGWSGFCDLNSSNASQINSPDSNFSLADSVIATLSDGSKGIVGSRLYFKDANDTLIDIVGFSDDTLQINPTNIISEQYYLVWSDYRIALVGDTLYLYYASDKNTTLATNVSLFDAKKMGQVVEVKLCIHSNDANDFAFCRQKAIY
jgi:type II secretory pathway pseudopilin PulG